MDISALLKKPPVLIGGIVLVVIIIIAAKRGSASTQVAQYSGGPSPTDITALQAQQIQADLESTKSAYGAQVSLSGIEAQKIVALAQIGSSTQLGLVNLDFQHDIAGKAITSAEIQQARALAQKQAEIDSAERVANFTTSRALTYAQITGHNQVEAIKAGKPSIWASFLGNLGRGLGSGLSTFIGGL